MAVPNAVDTHREAAPASGRALRLEVLGPLRIWRDGVELDPGPRQQAYLLALLLARAGRPTSTAELVDLIWGEDAPASALNVIHKYVGALRRLLEPALARADPARTCCGGATATCSRPARHARPGRAFGSSVAAAEVAL